MKWLCKIFGHCYHYWVDDGEVNGEQYWDKMYYEECQRCGKPTPNDIWERD